MFPSVTFRLYADNMASARYRGLIPAQQLQKLGFKEGKHWLVASKHNWDWHQTTKGFTKVCFDVCDDHFHDRWASHYRQGCEMASLVTCNSPAMAAVIEQETGRVATVIPDPYEQPEKTARVSESLLWFGHASNLGDLAPHLAKLSRLEIVTNLKQPEVTQWSPEAMDRAFDRAGLVVIPTGKSMAKSGNRAVESIRRGLFVVAGYLPAYADLGIWIGDIEEGVKWALSHQDEVLRRIKAAQSYVRDEYSPERIGKLWAEALCA